MIFSLLIHDAGSGFKASRLLETMVHCSEWGGDPTIWGTPGTVKGQAYTYMRLLAWNSFLLKDTSSVITQLEVAGSTCFYLDAFP